MSLIGNDDKTNFDNAFDIEGVAVLKNSHWHRKPVRKHADQIIEYDKRSFSLEFHAKGRSGLFGGDDFPGNCHGSGAFRLYSNVSFDGSGRFAQ
jgi:hypothetical protein